MSSPAAEGAALVSRFATDHDQKTALQFAFYNTLLFSLLGICIGGLIALYNMMYMFLSPMLWAVLVGTVLFPFKKKVTDATKGWLSYLQATKTTLLVGLIKFPFVSFMSLSELVYSVFMSQTGGLIVIAYTLLKILSYERMFMYVLSWMGRMYETIDSFILFFTRNWVFPVIFVYFCSYSAWIYVHEPGTLNKKLARTFSLPIWIYLLSFISLYFGPFRAAVFGLSGIVLALISAGLLGVEDGGTPNGSSISIEKDSESGSSDTPLIVQSSSSDDAKADSSENKGQDSVPEDRLDNALSGDRLLRIITGLVCLLWVVRHDSALLLVAIPLFFAAIRRAAEYVGLTSSICGAVDSLWQKVCPGVERIINITVAGPLRQFVRVLFTSDQLLVSSLHQKMDVLSSLVVMMMLAFSAIFVLLFVGFQLHSETVHLVRLSSNVVSSRPDWLGAAMNFTEDQLEENDIDIDDYVEQAYQQGRAWLAANVRSLTDAKDTKRADMLEAQVMQIVDNIYRMWEERNNANIESSTAVSRGDWLAQLQSVTDLHALKEEITLIVKENLDTLMGIAQSLWAVIVVNISFLTSILAAFAGVVLGFGMDIINFLIEVIVFLTMVYYLLSASTDRWLPLDWASRLASVTSSTDRSGGYDVTAAVEHAIFGVFVLSAKMSIFYGLYTYFVHSLFDLNIVFVPSLLAAVFAAIPIMAPYFVAVFGLFELWLVRGESAAALVFVAMSVAPMMFADATFYREVKGSHPYVTGLSIIGGMYWLGLQGSIIGPIILCSFLVLVNVYLQFAKPVTHVSDAKKLE